MGTSAEEMLEHFHAEVDGLSDDEWNADEWEQWEAMGSRKISESRQIRIKIIYLYQNFIKNSKFNFLLPKFQKFRLR